MATIHLLINNTNSFTLPDFNADPYFIFKIRFDKRNLSMFKLNMTQFVLAIP